MLRRPLAVHALTSTAFDGDAPIFGVDGDAAILGEARTAGAARGESPFSFPESRGLPRAGVRLSSFLRRCAGSESASLGACAAVFDGLRGFARPGDASIFRTAAATIDRTGHVRAELAVLLFARCQRIEKAAAARTRRQPAAVRRRG